MAIQGSSVSLQGGTGISLGNSNPQSSSSFQVQQPTGIPLQSAPKTVAPTPSPAPAQPGDFTAQINQLLASLKAQQAAYAPPLDISSIYSQAGAKAQANVNPYYTKQLQDFQAQQAQNKALQQQQTQMNIQNLQTQLANTLQGNSITQGRTAQDALTSEQQAGIQADQQQQTQGTQFDQARIDQAKQLASQGLTGSGLGNQQVLGSETARNTQESQQAQTQQQATQQTELLKNRTFEDLARSGDLATQSETQGETQANFDLNKYIQGQAGDLQNEQQTLEQQRLAQVSQETQSQAKLLVNQFIQSISNPAQRQAAVQAYGGAF